MKGFEFLGDARKCKKVQKSAEECEEKEVRYWEAGTGSEIEKLYPPHPPGICKDVKEKELEEGQFVSV